MAEIYLVGGTTARTDLDNYVSANISEENAIASMRSWQDFQGSYEDFHIDHIEIDDMTEHDKAIRAEERAKVLKPFIDCEEDLIHLENQMENMYEEWSCFNKLSKLESMGIDIVVKGTHIVGYLIDKIEQMKEGAKNENGF